ncbi:MAG TPA: tRNA (adenosine(37)-N6)-threonylcarbamoyltransferase complex dimerization subunit type 1 TsaB [Propionicimonas sp.]|nr:tRNA (adenosine(37)-N6)-threonylcarbamoyltransferase complex dimerization subunit type 1 TsaB [Propionicimonas sp.]HQA77770.1 tRNA (adenosine(37)-N6)-threonylcarbamoyltransferase complex dimerization subunit type 1 TsaB [Propionicimonas sp.]HQD96655.1 tRNA (adenosine(37)-N6)-threonylcarbamoyltransferase complex dimerization subunit type 1 TsaB [Propionicimonas sp.]
MTLTLAIDTAADVRAGLARDGVPLSRAVVADRRAHAEQLLPLVQQLLAEADATPSDLTEIVVGVGPGPFTGLRVGVVAALTLGEALGVEVRGVCSLDPVAQDWARQGAPADFAVVADARRKEVYWARYGADGARVAGPFVTSPDQVPAIPLAGAGAALAGVCSGPAELDPALLAAFGNQLPDAGHEPLYLRRPDAEVPTKRKSTLLLPRLAKMEKQ